MPNLGAPDPSLERRLPTYKSLPVRRSPTASPRYRPSEAQASPYGGHSLGFTRSGSPARADAPRTPSSAAHRRFLLPCELLPDPLLPLGASEDAEETFVAAASRTVERRLQQLEVRSSSFWGSTAKPAGFDPIVPQSLVSRRCRGAVTRTASQPVASPHGLSLRRMG